MPKLTEDYSRATIYQISHGDELCYIGSTADFIQRKYNHKSHWNVGKDMILYNKMRENNLTWDDMTMTVYEEFPVTDGEPLEKKYKLERRERELVLELKPKYNKGLPARNREDYLEYQTKYHNEVRKLKPDFKEKCLKAVKKYSENNPDKIKERRDKYSEKNKDELAEKRRERVECDICNNKYNKSSLTTHKKSCEKRKNDPSKSKCLKCNKFINSHFLKYGHDETCSGID